MLVRINVGTHEMRHGTSSSILASPAARARRRDAVQDRHPHVHHDHAGPEACSCDLGGLPAGRCLPDDLDPLLVEDHPKWFNRKIVDQEHGMSSAGRLVEGNLAST